MPNYSKLQQTMLSGVSDANIDFAALCRLLKRLGFVERVRGDHHIPTHEGVEEIVNLQSKGGTAKRISVRQVRGMLERYRFGATDVD